MSKSFHKKAANTVRFLSADNGLREAKSGTLGSLVLGASVDIAEEYLKAS